MSELAQQLEAKEQQLAQLKENQSKANCSSTYSSPADMRREMEIEELEDEIKALNKKIADN
jgi:hypothetical protein